MGFEDLTLDEMQRVALPALREALRVPSYRHPAGGDPAPEQVFSNLNDDPQIQDESLPNRPASRHQLLALLTQDSGADGTSLRSLIERFCRAHQAEGRELSSGSVLGRVHELEELAGCLNDQDSTSSLEETRAWLRDLLLLDPAVQLDRQRRELGAKKLSRWQLMSFATAKGDDPWQALEPRFDPVVNRLGLGHYAEKPASAVEFGVLGTPSARGSPGSATHCLGCRARISLVASDGQNGAAGRKWAGEWV